MRLSITALRGVLFTMPHVHSFAKTELRYQRAVARGFVPRAKVTPIGAASGAAVSQIIPVHLKSHFRRQMRVCQLAVAAQLILANVGIGAEVSSGTGGVSSSKSVDASIIGLS